MVLKCMPLWFFKILKCGRLYLQSLSMVLLSYTEYSSILKINLCCKTKLSSKWNVHLSLYSRNFTMIGDFLQWMLMYFTGPHYLKHFRPSFRKWLSHIIFNNEIGVSSKESRMCYCTCAWLLITLDNNEIGVSSKESRMCYCTCAWLLVTLDNSTLFTENLCLLPCHWL
jgi:hypothetical protein